MPEPMFPEKSPVRITVLRKLHHTDLMAQYTDPEHPWTMICQAFEEGQQFTVSAERPWDPPAGFCGWAWADIQKLVLGMARGGPNRFVTCCTDGYRPVLFVPDKLSEPRT